MTDTVYQRYRKATGPLVNLTKPESTFTLSDKETALIAALRKVPFGRVEVAMQDGQPQRIYKITENVAL